MLAPTPFTLVLNNNVSSRGRKFHESPHHTPRKNKNSMNSETIRTYQAHRPNTATDVYVDETAILVGQVSIGSNSSVWPGAVIRGDVNAIDIGANTNIQDGVILHGSSPSKDKPEGFSVQIGNKVTVGHRAVLHGCEIGDSVIIGIGSIVLDGAKIGDNTVVAAGSLVPAGKTLCGGYLYMGSPAKQMRPLTANEIENISVSAQLYVDLKNRSQAE
jgi:carbonic anhydrase/acetyltransferase-like protein (isoleucine patch superfamily)